MSVSIQQAALNALATWLAGKLTDCEVLPRWAPADFSVKDKTITLVPAGARRDELMDIYPIKSVNVGSNQATSTWQVRACMQPFQMDIWAKSYSERDDILARLDQLLSAGESPTAGLIGKDPFGHGVLLSVTDGWESLQTTADFDFDGPMVDDTSDSINRSSFRATIHGDAHFMLAVTATTPRQVSIQLGLLLNSDPESERETYTA